MPESNLTIITLNSDTILSRVIETVKRKRIPINKLNAYVCEENVYSAIIEINFFADNETKRLLVKQLEKIIEVVKVTE